MKKKLFSSIFSLFICNAVYAADNSHIGLDAPSKISSSASFWDSVAEIEKNISDKKYDDSLNKIKSLKRHIKKDTQNKKNYLGVVRTLDSEISRLKGTKLSQRKYNWPDYHDQSFAKYEALSILNKINFNYTISPVDLGRAYKLTLSLPDNDYVKRRVDARVIDMCYRSKTFTAWEQKRVKTSLGSVCDSLNVDVDSEFDWNVTYTQNDLFGVIGLPKSYAVVDFSQSKNDQGVDVVNVNVVDPGLSAK